MDNELAFDKFVFRMKSIDIKLECSLNYPWVYINRINGNKVVEKFQSKHGFTLGFLSLAGLTFSDLDVVFDIIRKYK